MLTAVLTEAYNYATANTAVKILNTESLMNICTFILHNNICFATETTTGELKLPYDLYSAVTYYEISAITMSRLYYCKSTITEFWEHYSEL